ncbi:MAG: carbohydrate deacetylase [Anaerolineae bacterium]
MYIILAVEETRLLIVNADDFGRTPGVTEGVLQAHERGIVTSTTAMVNLSGAERAVQGAGERAPELGMGVHLNITAGRPILPPGEIPSLVGSDGGFYPIRRLVARLGELALGQVGAELMAQVERFRSWGREPTHLDSHHHVLYLSSALFRVLVGVADRYHLPIRYPWPRGPISRGELARLAEAHRVSSDDLPSIMADCHAILRQSRLRTPDRCILSFYGPGATLEDLLGSIEGLPQGVSEMMCHPGLADADLRGSSGYAEERERELAILTDPQLQDVLRDEGVKLADFSVLR